MLALKDCQGLTGRQAEVLALVGEGHSNRVIGERLGISENGVKDHVSRLLAKFDVPTRAALVGAARGERPDPDAISPAEILRLLSDSLTEVLGATATATLLKRASKRAGIRAWDAQSPPATTEMQTVSALVAALWPLLIEMTGSVMVGRLQAQGFSASGDVKPTG